MVCLHDVSRRDGKNGTKNTVHDFLAMKLESIFLFSLLLLLPLTAMAQDETAKDFRTFTLYVENDVLDDTDSLYTSGLRLSWISPDLRDYRENSRLPRWSYPLIKRLPLVNKPGLQYSVSMSIGQNIYTPEDTESSDLVKDDRPYAGILYYAIGFHSKSSRQMDSLEFLLGIVGPHSYAEETQKKVHELCNNDIFNGWDNQLKDEPVLGVFYDRKWKLRQSKISSGFSYDLIPHVGAGLGNALIYAHAGAGVRFGWNLPNDFGTFTIRPGSDTNAAIDETDPRFFLRDQRFGIHVFAAVGGSWVLRNIFLDGNAFRDSHSVDKKPFIGNYMVGVGLVLSRFKMTFAHIHQTKEFKIQKREHSFTAISLSFSY